MVAHAVPIILFLLWEAKTELILSYLFLLWEAKTELIAECHNRTDRGLSVLSSFVDSPSTFFVDPLPSAPVFATSTRHGCWTFNVTSRPSTFIKRVCVLDPTVLGVVWLCLYRPTTWIRRLVLTQRILCGHRDRMLAAVALIEAK